MYLRNQIRNQPQTHIKREPNITFSTCWYLFKSKFNRETYLHWIENFLSITNHFFLVIYCDEESSPHIETFLSNPYIKRVIKPLDQFYNYRYKEKWIKNHEKNWLLRETIDWPLNMLWAEKVHFVSQTMHSEYFPKTDFYGWCDIGYFRDDFTMMKSMSKNPNLFDTWCCREKIERLDKTKIYYAMVNNNSSYIRSLFNRIQHKNAYGLPQQPIPADQTSIAGGFFLAYREKIDWWKNTFDQKLALYFHYDYLVKDDQIIIVDIVFSSSNVSHFFLVRENMPPYNNWFLFLRYLL